MNGRGYSIKKLVEGMSALLTNILGVGGPENFAIVWVSGLVRPPCMIMYDRNSVGAWVGGP